MDIFNGNFLLSLEKTLTTIIEKLVDQLLEQQALRDRYMNLKRTCEYVGGLDPATLTNWVRKYGLKKIEVVGVVRYDRQDIDEFLEKHKVWFDVAMSRREKAEVLLKSVESFVELDESEKELIIKGLIKGLIDIEVIGFTAVEKNSKRNDTKKDQQGRQSKLVS